MTDEQIIDRLGGTVAVAKRLGLERGAVSNWKKRGISAAGRYQIAALAIEDGLELPKRFPAPARAAAE